MTFFLSSSGQRSSFVIQKIENLLLKFPDLLKGKSDLQNNILLLSFLQSAHFQNTVARSSFLSKSWSFLIPHQLNQNKVNILKLTIILKDVRILQLCSKSEPTLVPTWGDLLEISCGSLQTIIQIAILQETYLIKVY